MDWLLLTCGWLLFFTIHSLTASVWFKQRIETHWPRLMPAYRLIFNLLALLTLLPVGYLIHQIGGDMLWQWQGPAFWITNGLAALAVGAVIWSLRYYDGKEFIGLRQWKEKHHKADLEGGLTLSRLHYYVRHPWYSLALVILWTRSMNLALLITAVMLTLYFIIGSRLEEQKLIHAYGEAYRQYRSKVPGLIPLPWRHLNAETAARLETLSKTYSSRTQ